ncbi:MAG TPA: hypothetical protein PLB92_05850 [Rhodoglobus sp.]|nr:hypothetical protein [Rhodoglobus sp.]
MKNIKAWMEINGVNFERAVVVFPSGHPDLAAIEAILFEDSKLVLHTNDEHGHRTFHYELTDEAATV